MSEPNRSLSSAGKWTVVALVVAAVGVVTQMVSGHPYPTIPPVFFILLVPAGLIAFWRLRWMPAIAVFAGLLLIVGLLARGDPGRLFDPSRYGDSLFACVGLWIQMLAVVAAVVAGIIATIQNYRAATRPS